MGTRVKCKHCGKVYNVRAELAGKRIKCKSCDTAIQVPRKETDDDDFLSALDEAVTSEAASPAHETQQSASPASKSTERKVARPKLLKRHIFLWGYLVLVGFVVLFGFGDVDDLKLSFVRRIIGVVCMLALGVVISRLITPRPGDLKNGFFRGVKAYFGYWQARRMPASLGGMSLAKRAVIFACFWMFIGAQYGALLGKIFSAIGIQIGPKPMEEENLLLFLVFGSMWMSGILGALFAMLDDEVNSNFRIVFLRGIVVGVLLSPSIFVSVHCGPMDTEDGGSVLIGIAVSLLLSSVYGAIMATLWCYFGWLSKPPVSFIFWFNLFTQILIKMTPFNSLIEGDAEREYRSCRKRLKNGQGAQIALQDVIIQFPFTQGARKAEVLLQKSQ